MYLLAFVILFISEIIYIKLAKKFNIVDIPNNRSSHLKYTIRGGGIIFWLSLLIYFFTSNYNYPYFFIGFTLMSFISFWDDIAGLSILSRLFIHLIAAGLLLYELIIFSTPLLIILSLIILVVGIINAFNFMDGINGMTVGNSIIVLGILWFINNYHLRFVDDSIIINSLLGLTVFFIFNFRNNAICFAGDVGSISIAFIIIFLLFKLIIKENNPIYILFLGVYGVESILTIFHRIIIKENIFKAHRLHLYQRIIHSIKIPQLIITIIYMLIQLIICIIVVTNLKNSIGDQILIGVLIITILSILYVFIKIKLSKYKKSID